MSDENKKVLNEIRDMLKVLIDEQRSLMSDVQELKAEQKKIHEELKLSNFVLNNITFRNEILN